MEELNSIQSSIQVVSRAAATEQRFEAQFQGRRLTINNNTLSLLDTAKEEITQALSERLEKPLAERKMMTNDTGHIIDLSKFDQRLPKVSIFDKGFQKFAKSLLASTFATSAQIKAQIEKTYKDPTLQFLVTAMVVDELDNLLKNGERRLMRQEKLKKELLKQMSNLFEKHGARIRAGVNTAEITRAFTHLFDKDDYQKSQSFYADTIVDYQGLTKAYKKIVGELGEKNFLDGVEFMLQALAEDLNSQTSSIAKPLLRTIINDMGQLKILGGVHEHCLTTLGRLANNGHLQNVPECHSLLAGVLQLKDKSWLASSDALSLGEQIGVLSIAGKISFLRELKQIVAMIPTRIYADPHKRQKMLDAIQDGLDDLIQEEEELEDA